jgi:hypothetical protein
MLGKRRQWVVFIKDIHIVRQEVIVQYIHDSPTVQPVKRPEDFLCPAGGIVVIGKGIYMPMQLYSYLH